MNNNFPDAKVLKVNLSDNLVEFEKIPGNVYRLYPGGSSLGVYIASKNIQKNTDPLSEGNCIVFSVSPLTGLPISGISRMNVTAKSPLTGGIGDSQAGGFFPAQMKLNGLDAIVITGKSAKPVYLFIDGEKVSIKDGSKIWGKVTGEAEKSIKDELGREDIEIAQIGPGGENLVKFEIGRAHV